MNRGKLCLLGMLSASTLVAQEREIHDSDGDGWCDLWCSIFEVEHRDAKVDTDGDGKTDFQEMLAMTNPHMEEAPPLDPAEARKLAKIQKAKAEKNWGKRVAAAKAKGMRDLIKRADREKNDPRLEERISRMKSLKLKAQKARNEVIGKRRALEQKAAQMGVVIEDRQLDGTLRRFVGEQNGVPIFTGSQNRLAAGSVSADELWPANAAPWQSGSTGLNLTGNGQTLATWENDGGVRTSHGAFGGRVNQRDGAGLDTGGHATEVTGVMVGSGSGNGDAQGVAYQASVESFDTNALGAERLSAADGTYGQVLTVGNNSWGVLTGWRLVTVGFVGNTPILRWFWHGGGFQGDTVDPKFGRYTEDLNGLDLDCVDLDKFVNVDAPHHLPVYSAGNDRGQGPQDAQLRVPPNNLPTANFGYRVIVNGQEISRNPNFFPRDWSDGDDGGYDTLLVPATAKNVLTVGACFDVTHVDNGVTVPGFGPGSVVTAADFSGAGPTDDGRIKPDLVAVGDALSSARTALGLPVTDGLITPIVSSDSAYQTAATEQQSGLPSEGTSFAAPAVSGGFALMLQRRSQLYPSLPASDRWNASTLKALAINGVDDPGSPGPDYRLGHGLFNAANSVGIIDEDFAGGRGSQIKEFELQSGESVSWLVSVDPNEPLSLTAAWSDPAGPGQPYTGAADITTPVLVNNLNLQIEHVDSGQVLLPWILNPDLAGESASARGAAATRGVDSVNNVERISEASPFGGTYRITVTHSGGLPGNPAPTAQEVSIVSVNAVPLLPTIDSIEVSPNQDEFILTYSSDPGAYYVVQSSTSLEANSWTDEGTTLAETTSNTIMVTTQSGDQRRFWRLERSQQ